MRPTELKLQRVATELGPLALLTIDNGEDWQKPTVLGRTAMESLAVVLDELEKGDFVAAVVTGKPFVYTVDGATAHLRGSGPSGEEQNPAYNLHYEVTIQK